MRFYREGSLWYADLPEYLAEGGSKADCLMVAGADKLLDAFADGKNEVNVLVTPQHIDADYSVPNKRVLLKLKLDGLRYGWGFYDIVSSNVELHVYEVGLCPVSTFVFGKHPEYISIVEED